MGGQSSWLKLALDGNFVWSLFVQAQCNQFYNPCYESDDRYRQCRPDPLAIRNVLRLVVLAGDAIQITIDIIGLEITLKVLEGFTGQAHAEFAWWPSVVSFKGLLINV